MASLKPAQILDFLDCLEIYPTSPFYFDATLHKPDHFPSADNYWESGVRWQTMLWQGKRLGLKFQGNGTIDNPKIILSIWSEGKLDDQYLNGLKHEIVYRYNFDLDLQDFYRRFENHPKFRQVLHRWRGMRPLNYCSLYEYIIIAIVLQNATVRRSVSMMQTLLENYGIPLKFDGKELYCFWSPEEIHLASEGELRGLKVGYRAKSIKRVTQAFIDKEINEMFLRNQPITEQRKALLNLYGIGPASVDYLLTDVYHHLDEMNTIPPWEQKIYSKLFFDIDPEEPVPVSTLMYFFDQHFKGYRSLAIHYFWEDLFWQRKNQGVEWLNKLIRL